MDSTTSSRIYETDFYGWIQHQADAMRTGNLASLDLENLIEEIDGMGKSQQRALESRLEILLMHLLKWQYQPTMQCPSWRFTIREQRNRLADHLAKNPSLKPKIPEAQASAYRYAVFGACRETGLDESVFPPQCPWPFEQAMNHDFWPCATAVLPCSAEPDKNPTGAQTDAD